MIRVRMVIGCGAALLLLAACGGSKMPPVATTLGEYCATSDCACFKTDRPFWLNPEKTDIVWDLDGNATCPEGFALRAVGKKP